MKEAVGKLSGQKKACLRLAYHRLSHGEIAAELDLSTNTVKTYFAQIRSGLGGATTAMAAEALASIEGPPPSPRGIYPAGGLPSAPAPLPSDGLSSESGERPRLELREAREVYSPIIAQDPWASAALPPRRSAVPNGVRIVAISVAITIGLMMAVVFGAAVFTATSDWIATRHLG